jgi:hypothetical protein
MESGEERSIAVILAFFLTLVALFVVSLSYLARRAVKTLTAFEDVEIQT